MAISRSLMNRQLQANGGIMNVSPREKFGLGSSLKKFVRKIIPNEVSEIAVKTAPFVAPFNPALAAAMGGLGSFDQTGRIGDSLKNAALTYGLGQGARFLGGAGLQGNPFEAPLFSSPLGNVSGFRLGRDVPESTFFQDATVEGIAGGDVVTAIDKTTVSNDPGFLKNLFDGISNQDYQKVGKTVLDGSKKFGKAMFTNKDGSIDKAAVLGAAAFATSYAEAKALANQAGVDITEEEYNEATKAEKQAEYAGYLSNFFGGKKEGGRIGFARGTEETSLPMESLIKLLKGDIDEGRGAMDEEMEKTLNIEDAMAQSNDMRFLNELMNDLDGKYDEDEKDFYYKSIVPQLIRSGEMTYEEGMKLLEELVPEMRAVGGRIGFDEGGGDFSDAKQLLLAEKYTELLKEYSEAGLPDASSRALKEANEFVRDFKAGGGRIGLRRGSDKEVAGIEAALTVDDDVTTYSDRPTREVNKPDEKGILEKTGDYLFDRGPLGYTTKSIGAVFGEMPEGSKMGDRRFFIYNALLSPAVDALAALGFGIDIATDIIGAAVTGGAETVSDIVEFASRAMPGDQTAEREAKRKQPAEDMLAVLEAEKKAKGGRIGLRRGTDPEEAEIGIMTIDVEAGDDDDMEDMDLLNQMNQMLMAYSDAVFTRDEKSRLFRALGDPKIRQTSSSFKNLHKILKNPGMFPEDEMVLKEFLKMKKADGGRIKYGQGTPRIRNVDTMSRSSLTKALNAMEIPETDSRDFDDDQIRELLIKFAPDLYISGKAKGGRIKYASGANRVSELLILRDSMLAKDPDADVSDIEAEIFQLTGKEFKSVGGISNVPTGKIRKNSAGIKERDYRDEGGFVPVGIKEKADDVPAMLSKNEFVITADAVRGIGGGDVEKGSKKLYNLMKNAEQVGRA